jgi:hypothetical protein
VLTKGRLIEKPKKVTRKKKAPWLPDGIFSNQKSKFGSILEGLAMEGVGIFYGNFVNFPASYVTILAPRLNVERPNIERPNVNQLEIEFCNVEQLEINQPKVEM